MTYTFLVNDFLYMMYANLQWWRGAYIIIMTNSVLVFILQTMFVNIMQTVVFLFMEYFVSVP